MLPVNRSFFTIIVTDKLRLIFFVAFQKLTSFVYLYNLTHTDDQWGTRYYVEYTILKVIELMNLLRSQFFPA